MIECISEHHSLTVVQNDPNVGSFVKCCIAVMDDPSLLAYPNTMQKARVAICICLRILMFR